MPTFTGPVNEAITVTTGATLLVEAGGDSDRPQTAIVAVLGGGQTVYVGYTSGVTTSNGLPIASGEMFEFNEVNQTLYGIVAATTQEVRVMKRFG